MDPIIETMKRNYFLMLENSLRHLFSKKIVRMFVIFFTLMSLMDMVGETLILLIVASWFLADIPLRPSR